jgi:hypothetical protein
MISKLDNRRAVEAKMRMWLADGAKLAWVIDPLEATLSIYRPDQPVETLIRPEVVEADAIVPGFRLETARLGAK